MGPHSGKIGMPKRRLGNGERKQAKEVLTVSNPLVHQKSYNMRDLQKEARIRPGHDEHQVLAGKC